MPQDKSKFRNPRRAMPGQKLPDIGTRAAEDKAFRLVKDREWTTNTQFYMTAEPNPRSGMRGFHINKLDFDDAHSHGISFDVEGTPHWEIGMDYVSYDFILAFDHTAYDDAGADVFRMSRAEDDTVSGSRSTKFFIGYRVGTPAAEVATFNVVAGDTLGGIRVSCSNSASARSAIAILQRDANHWAMFNCADAIKFGCDWQKTNVASFFIYDEVVDTMRLYIDENGRTFIGSGIAPTARLHLAAGAAAASGAPFKLTSGTHLTTPEAGAMEYNGTDLFFTRASARHCVLTESITDGINVAVGTTTGTKIGTTTSQKLGFFNATPVVQPVTNSDIRTALVNLGLLAGGANPLNTNGGGIVVGTASFAGAISGSGVTAFSIKRFALTFPSDADYTLATGEADALVIDVQTGVTTATRNIIVPNTGSALYIVVNRNAQSVTLKTAAGTGITIASGRARIIYFPTGVNAFSLTGANDYTL